MEILYRTSVKYTSLWIAQFIKKWIAAHLWHAVSPPMLRKESMMLSFLHGDTVVQHFPWFWSPQCHISPWHWKSFPLQRMVVFCSPSQEPSLCTPLQRFCLHILSRRAWGMWGLWAVLVAASLLLTQLQTATQTLSCHEENLLNWDTINNSFCFNSLPVLTWTFLCPSQLPSTSPAAKLCCSSLLNG